MGKNTTLKRIAALTVAIAALFVGFQTFQILRRGDSSMAGVNAPGATPDASPDMPRGIPVRVARAVLGEVREALRLTATLGSARSTPLFSHQAGIVAHLPVEEGSVVRKGKTVLRLDDRELKLNLKRARVRLERENEEWERQKTINEQALSDRQAYRDARFAYELKKVTLEKLVNERQRWENESRRIEISYQSQLASEKERDEARYALAQARFEESRVRLELKQATEDWERIRKLDERSLIDEEAYSAAKFAYRESLSEFNLARLKHSQATLTALQDGVVVKLDVDRGDYVSPNTRLMILEDLEDLEAVVNLPERHWAVIRQGQQVSVMPQALPGVEIAASVRRKNPTIDADSGTFKVTVALKRGGHPEVKPGMFVTLNIRLATRSDALLVPRQAVLGEEAERFVYIVENGRGARRSVRTGVTQGEQMEILSGLEEGAQVVMVGQYGLKPGSLVRILAEEPPEDTPDGSPAAAQ